MKTAYDIEQLKTDELLLACWHCGPANWAAHVQRYPPLIAGVHAPPFRHGELSQGAAAKIMKKQKQMC